MDADSALPIRGFYMKFGGFPGGSVGKNQPANAGDTGLIPRSRRSLRGGHGNPLQYSCLENPMDKIALWAPWGHQESDMTETT